MAPETLAADMREPGGAAMTAAAAVTLRRHGAPGLLIAYADAVAGMPIGPDAKRLRRNAAARLLAMHPRPAEWMTKLTPARLADLARTGAWSFLAWCFVEGHVRPDLDLLLAKVPATSTSSGRRATPTPSPASCRSPNGSAGAAPGPPTSPGGGLSLLCLTAGKTLDELTDDDFDTFADALAQAPSAGHHTWTHNSARLFILHRASR